MEPLTVTASAIIQAPPEEVHKIVADYRNGHPRILPKPYFLSLDVEEGGFGAGTTIRFQMRILGQTQTFHSVISEPEPGRRLVETDIASGVVTTFTFEPLDNGRSTRVGISTQINTRPGLAGRVEGFMTKSMLRRIYKQELELLAGIAKR